MAVDMFLKIKDVKGEAMADKHKDEIDVLAWSWGMSQSGSFHAGSGGGAGKVDIQDLSFTKWVDKATPNLMKFCSNGKHLQEATLTVQKAGEKPVPYVTITMKKVMITSVSAGGSGGEDRLTENVTLNFAEVDYEYTPQKEDGSAGTAIPYKWDIPANKEK